MTFFDTYSYKQKNYALVLLFVLLIAAVYKRSISPTLEIKNYRTELVNKLERAKSAHQEIKLKYSQIAGLNQFLGKENSTVEKVQQGFLNFYAKRSKGLEVYQIDEVLNFKHPDFQINTHRIVLKGDFLSTLRFLYNLEKDFSLAKLLNVHFEYKKYSSDEDPDLYTTILIQNYIR